MTPGCQVFLAAQRAYGFMKGCSFDVSCTPDEAPVVLANIQSGLAKEAEKLEVALVRMNKHLKKTSE